MKKIAIAILLLTGFTMGANAQDYGKKIRLGVSGAPLLAWISPQGNAAESDGTRFTFNYGLNADFRLGQNENYYFSTGLFMMNVGGDITYKALAPTGTTADLETTYRLGYVNIPFLLKLRSNEIGYSTYFARIGFDGGVNINSRGDYAFSFENTTQRTSEDDVDFSDNTQLFRVGLHIEGGMEYNLGGNTNVLIGLEWNNGLTNVFTKEVTPLEQNTTTGAFEEGDRLKSVTNFLALNLGVYF